MSPSVQKSVRDNIQKKMQECILQYSAKDTVKSSVFLVYGVFDASMLMKFRPAGGGMELISHTVIGPNGSRMIKASARLLKRTKAEGLWSQSPYYSKYYSFSASDIAILSFISPQYAASTGNFSTEACPRTTHKRQ